MKVQRLESKTVTCFRGSVIVYGGVKHNIDYRALGPFVWPVRSPKLWPVLHTQSHTKVLLEITEKSDRANRDQRARLHAATGQGSASLYLNWES